MKLGLFVSDYALGNDTIDRLNADELGLILVLNGVYHATQKYEGKACPLLHKAKNVYVLSEDLETRGIDTGAVDSKAKVVTYSDLVDVIMNDYEKIAWL